MTSLTAFAVASVDECGWPPNHEALVGNAPNLFSEGSTRKKAHVVETRMVFLIQLRGVFFEARARRGD